MRTPLLLLATLLSGCASAARPPDPERAARLEIGKSTKRDVVDMLGLPNRVTRAAAGGDRWTYYRWSDITIVHADVIVATDRSRSLRKDVAAIVEFDDEGRVADVANGEELK